MKAHQQTVLEITQIDTDAKDVKNTNALCDAWVVSPLIYPTLSWRKEGKDEPVPRIQQSKSCGRSGIPQAPEAWWWEREEEAPSWRDMALTCIEQMIKSSGMKGFDWKKEQRHSSWQHSNTCIEIITQDTGGDADSASCLSAEDGWEVPGLKKKIPPQLMVKRAKVLKPEILIDN